MSDQDTIRQRAFELWVAEGRPHGRDMEHWLRAEAELAPAASSRRKEPASKRQSGGKKVAAKTEAGTKTKKQAPKEQPANPSAKRTKTLAKA